MQRWRVGGVVVAAMVVASCSVSTPRDGFTQGQPVIAGSQTRGGPSTSLAAGDATAPIGDGVTGSTPAGGGGTSGAGAGTRSGGGGTATTVAGAATPTPGVTDKSIKLAALGGFTGDYGPIVQSIYDNGFAVWVDDVNKRGGINGRKVEARTFDTKDTVEGAVAACKQVQQAGVYLALSIVGFKGADAASVDCLDKAGVTTVAFNLSSFSDKWKHTYSAGDPYKIGIPLATYITNVIGERGKIGVFYAQNEPVSRASRAGLLAGMQEIKISPAHEEPIASGQGSFVAELNRMRSSGATTVAMMVSGNEALGILRDAKAIGYNPKWTGLYWTADENSASGGALMRGAKAARHWASVDSPAYAAYVKTANDNGKRVTNSSTLALYGMGLITGKILQNAGTTPTAAGLGPAIESIVDYDDGIWHLSFGKGVRVADIAVWPMECCNSDNTWHGTGPARTRF